MSKKILFFCLFILIFLIPSKQDPNAKTWERHDTTVYARDINAAIDRGDSIIIDGCEIIGSLTREGTPESPDTIKSFIIVYSSNFLNLVSFVDCYFAKEARFSGDTFSYYVDFSKTTFNENAWFFPAFFDKDVYFLLAKFRGFASFWAAEFRGKVDLRYIEFNDFYISWKQLKDHLICDPPTSFKLMKQFEERRQLDDADGVYLFLKDQERLKKPWYVRYPEYWFIQLTCGYGRRPLYTFILSIILVIFFAVFFTNSKAIKEIEKESGRRWLPRLYRDVPQNWRKRFYYALYFSLHTFIIGVVSDWHATDEFLIKKRIEIKLFKFGPNIKLTPRFKFRTLSMIEGALGWILVIILIISLERTIGR